MSSKKSAPKLERPPVLYDKTQPLIAQLEERLQGRFIAY